MGHLGAFLPPFFHVSHSTVLEELPRSMAQIKAEKRAAAAYMLLETSTPNGIIPQACMTWALGAIADPSVNCTHELSPWHFSEAQLGEELYKGIRWVFYQKMKTLKENTAYAVERSNNKNSICELTVCSNVCASCGSLFISSECIPPRTGP